MGNGQSGWFTLTRYKILAQFGKGKDLNYSFGSPSVYLISGIGLIQMKEAGSHMDIKTQKISVWLDAALFHGSG